MGLLDDAIREHLELKRRRGADPEEVSRQEEEALGDPRGPAADALPGAAVALDVTPVTPGPGVGEPEPGDEDGPVPADEELDTLPEPELEPAADEDLAPGPEAGPEPPSARERDPEPWLEDEPPTAEHPPPAPPEPAAEHDATPPVDEDVLEETPDFLQETPEHDRLWFEQRPPRDFDFDN
jgi:hypothetical protein